MNRILIIDDDKELCVLIKRSVLSEDIEADFCNTGKEGLRKLKEKEYQLVILDVMMPGMDGFAALKELRKTSKIPVLMLTARGEAEDKFVGFENGADDYLLKPFLPKELLFRVQAILKRVYPEKERKVFFEAATVDLEKAIVQRSGENISLTAKEFQLFEKLILSISVDR